MMTDPFHDASEMSLSEQGFAMLPEWHSHAATWMAWPHNKETWPENLVEAQSEFLDLAAAIAEDEPVLLMCHGETQIDQFLDAVNRRSEKVSNIQIVDIDTNDAWSRDYAPTFLLNQESQEQLGLDWRYNAWGGKYPPFDLDQKASKLICDFIVKSKPKFGPGCSHHPLEFCFEGGAIEMGPDGVLLSTRSCALDPNRNRDMEESKVESIFSQCLGAKKVIWLAGDAITGDDTDGHIDQLARFTPKGSILYAWCDDETDNQHPLLSDNLVDLQRGMSFHELDFELIALPLPEAIQLHGQRLPASYCNFYITNNKVIVPEFGHPSDKAAIEIIGSQFPDHQTIGLPSLNLAYGQGSFHCLTQQQPAIT